MAAQKKTYVAPTPPVRVEAELEPGRVFLIRSMPPPYMLAAWSKTLPATDKVFRTDTNFTHVHAARSETYLLQEQVDTVTGEVKDLIQPLQEARALVRRMIGPRHKDFTNPGWTYSALARTVNAWLDIHQVSTQREKLICEDWAYQLCWPGVYSHLTLYDMTAAYWQIWQRCQSPKFNLFPGEIEWQPLAVEQRRRWDRMMRLLSDPLRHKQLKLKIVGVNLVGWRGKNRPNEFNTRAVQLWQGGELVRGVNKPGALLPLALLAVRCTFELTQVQSELSSSIYSNSDCVVTESRTQRMDYWDSLNIHYRKKAEGVSIIRRVGAWAIGDRQTLDFQDAQAREIMFRHRPNRVEDTSLHRLVLG